MHEQAKITCGVYQGAGVEGSSCSPVVKGWVMEVCGVVVEEATPGASVVMRFVVAVVDDGRRCCWLALVKSQALAAVLVVARA